MPRSSSPAFVVVNTLLIPLGAVALVAGIVGALSAPGIGWAFALLALCGAMVLVGGVHGVLAWGHAVRVDDATEREMVAAVRARPHVPPARTGPVLAHWTYEPAEWRAYAAGEIRFRTREALGMGAVTFALGTPILGVLDGNWGVAAAVSGAVGGLIALGRWLVAFSAYRRNLAAPGDVIVGTKAILVNRRFEVIQDRRVKLGGARVLETERPALLEVTILVPGRYRRIAEEYRIPIPAGREDEARAVARELEALRR